MTSLEGKVALITGANGGLGTSVTKAFLDAGATVVGVSRSIADSDFGHNRFIAIPGEVSSYAGAVKAVESAIAGARRIDVLAHLVGAFTGGTPVAETGDDAIDEMIDVNFKSTFFITKAVLGEMIRQKSGRIIAIGSKAAIEAAPGAAAYSASKAAVVALIRAIAAENAGHGVSANIVLPGTMDTPTNRKFMPQADFSKWVQTEQVASLLVALASDNLSQVNGAAIPIFGSEL